MSRFARWIAVRYGAWTLRRGIPTSRLRHAIDHAFAHQDDAWREQLFEEMRQRHRARTMREINA